MFATRAFPSRYFARRYWPAVGAEPSPTGGGTTPIGGAVCGFTLMTFAQSFHTFMFPECGPITPAAVTIPPTYFLGRQQVTTGLGRGRTQAGVSGQQGRAQRATGPGRGRTVGDS